MLSFFFVLMTYQSDVISGVEPTAIDRLRASPGVTVLSEPAMNLGYVSLNNQHPPLDNRLVRLALNHAIDKDYLVNVLFSNSSVVAKGILPPGMLGHDPQRRGFAYDPVKAKRLLAEAGYPNGFTVTFTTHDRPRVYNPVGAKLAERIQQDLARVGVTVRIDQMEFPAFLDRAKSGQFQMANSGWNTDNGDPDNFIYELAGREDNEVKYSNPEATALMRQAAGEPDQAKRAGMYTRAEDMLCEDPPFVFLNHAKQVMAISNRVKRFHLHPTAVTHLEQVDVEPQ